MFLYEALAWFTHFNYIIARFFMAVWPGDTHKMMIDFQVRFIGNIFGYSEANILILQAQARLESGNLTSDLYEKQNNMWGMNTPARRPTLALKAPAGTRASYSTLSHSTIDRILWDKYNNIPGDVTDYATRVGRALYVPVAEYPEYSRRWLATVNSVKADALSIYNFYAIFALGMTFWLVMKFGGRTGRLLGSFRRRRSSRSPRRSFRSRFSGMRSRARRYMSRARGRFSRYRRRATGWLSRRRR